MYIHNRQAYIYKCVYYYTHANKGLSLNNTMLEQGP